MPHVRTSSANACTARHGHETGVNVTTTTGSAVVTILTALQLILCMVPSTQYQPLPVHRPANLADARNPACAPYAPAVHSRALHVPLRVVPFMHHRQTGMVRMEAHVALQPDSLFRLLTSVRGGPQDHGLGN